MSADNYFTIRRHPLGGFAAVMGFMSDDSEPQARESDEQFSSMDAAWAYALGEYAEYGVTVHPECCSQGNRYVMVVTVDPSLLDGDESIENAAHVVNNALDLGIEGTVPPSVQPLSEVIAS